MARRAWARTWATVSWLLLSITASRSATGCKRLNSSLPIVSICCVATGLIDFNPSIQRFHMQRCKAFLDLCYEYEAKNLLLVIGEYIWEKQVIPPKEQWETGVKNCRASATVCRLFLIS